MKSELKRGEDVARCQGVLKEGAEVVFGNRTEEICVVQLCGDVSSGVEGERRKIANRKYQYGKSRCESVGIFVGGQ